MRMKIRLAVVVLFLLTDISQAYAQYDKQQFFYRGRQLLMEGRFQSAIENFNHLIQLDKNLYEAYFFRGIGKYNLGDFMGAKKDFDRAIGINPVFTMAYHYRAITYSRMGHYQEALNDLAEAVDLRPNYNGLFFSRGVTYLLSQQFDKAIADFNRFIRFEPRVNEAYLNRGACYLYLKDTLKALDDYNTAILLNKFDPEGYVRRSRIYVMQEDYEKALTDLDRALLLDSVNTYALFNRAIVRFNKKDLTGALEDLNAVLSEDPGNALSLYNRALIRAQIGDYNNALEDYDRVISINPNNVLAYYNRAAVYIELERFHDALADYSKAIDLYPDFANAYMNRSYVKNRLGKTVSARQDYEIAQSKVKEYKSRVGDSTYSAFADTTRRFDRLLALDADFAKKDFNNELLQYRDVDIRLKPLFKILNAPEQTLMAIEQYYYYPPLEKFLASLGIPMQILSEAPELSDRELSLQLDRIERQIAANPEAAYLYFVKGVLEFQKKQFNAALLSYNKAIELEPGNVFYYINRAALQSEMIEFISSMDSNVQVLTLDDAGATRARVNEQNRQQYDYSAAIGDLKKAASIAPDFAYLHYDLGNLHCLADNLPEAINEYTQAINLYPYLGQAYYNRGLIQIYLKEREKGCMDVSTAGELGLKDAYSVIKKFCVKEEN